MTEKRFISEDDCCGYYTEIIDNEKELDLSLHNPKKNLIIEELIDLLNEQHEEIQQLKIKIEDTKLELENTKEHNDTAHYELYQVKKENEQLKEKLESLDEIIDNQIYEVKHTHKNCKKVGIAELKKLKKVLICHNIIQDGDD